MQIRTCIPLLLLCSLACSNTKEEKSTNAENNAKTEIEFDKTKWRIKEVNGYDQPDYPYRNKMLKDLIDNQTLKGLKKEELMDMLGRPDHTDSGYLFYMIAQKRVYFFPLRTKTLVIKLSKDSTVEWRKIHGR